MPTFPIALVNAADLDSGALEGFCGALRTYRDKYLAPFWPELQGLTFDVWKGSTPPETMASLVFTPTITVANSLGYHTDIMSTSSAIKLPIGFVELDAIKNSGLLDDWKWVTATHELAEMAINPMLDQFVLVGTGQRYYPKEVCDPVTSDSFEVDGYRMANVTTPSYWRPGVTPRARERYDIMGFVGAPLPRIPANGYMQWYELGKWQSGWGESVAPEMVSYAQRKSGHRRHRIAIQNPEPKIVV